jgi:hypothetical protein
MSTSAISVLRSLRSMHLSTTRRNCLNVAGRLSVFSHLSASLLRVLAGVEANKGIN